jgi:hypothetical protein
MGRTVVGFAFGLILSACLGANLFPFKYYTLEAKTYDGKLLGPTSDQDLLLSMCSPGEADKAPCMVIFTSEFLRLKDAYKKCQVDLDASQRGIE